jgi:hypothetical protein
MDLEPHMRNGHLVVEHFFDGAAEVREAFEAHFRNPMSHNQEHQVWNYWYVPDFYTYFRTNPDKVIPKSLLARFVDRLNSWSMANLGLTSPHPPWLSLYVNGCGQTIHNDSKNGQLGYVYSITKWEERNFLGGETILFKQEQYWGTPRMRMPGAGVSFYEKIPSLFNQLLLFDDRIIHGVSTIQGTMDPLYGRVVLHGHLRADTLEVTGTLAVENAIQALKSTMKQINELSRSSQELIHGFITLRLKVTADGRVSAVSPLCDRILSMGSDNNEPEIFKSNIFRMLSGVQFPVTSSSKEITLPILIGG